MLFKSCIKAALLPNPYPHITNRTTLPELTNGIKYQWYELKAAIGNAIIGDRTVVIGSEE